MINIARIPKANLLAALVNQHPFGHGMLREMTPAALVATLHPVVTVAECSKYIEQLKAGAYRPDDLDIDYFAGRPIKTHLGHDEANEWLYDRDAGPGAFERVVASLRKEFP